MKTDYFISILTSKDLSAEMFAPAFLEAWLNNGNSKLRPEKFSHGEPVRYDIEERGGIPAVLEAWKETMLMFKRVSEPKFTVDTEWSRLRKLNPRPYLGCVRVWLSRKARDDLALEFFDFLVRWFEPEFGSITTSEDYDRKHFLSYPTFKPDGTYTGRAEASIGTDFLCGIPGIYWITYMTPDVLDAENIKAVGNKVVKRDRRGGHFIKAYNSSSLIGTETGLAAEKAIADILGSERFFNAAAWLKAQEAKAK